MVAGGVVYMYHVILLLHLFSSNLIRDKIQFNPSKIQFNLSKVIFNPSEILFNPE